MGAELMIRALTPAVQILLKLHNIKSNLIKATGPKGHILKGDVLSFLNSMKAASTIKKAYDYHDSAGSDKMRPSSCPILIKVSCNSKLPSDVLLKKLQSMIRSSTGKSGLDIVNGLIPDVSNYTKDTLFYLEDNSNNCRNVTLGIVIDATKWDLSELSEIMGRIEKGASIPETLLL